MLLPEQSGLIMQLCAHLLELLGDLLFLHIIKLSKLFRRFAIKQLS